IIPGLMLVVFYLAYVIFCGRFRPSLVPPAITEERVAPLRLLASLLPALLWIALVLGSILTRSATPTEAAGVGALGASLLALWKRQLTMSRLLEVMRSTTRVSAMIFTILIGASLFSLVFRGFGGEELVHTFFSQLPGGV